MDINSKTQLSKSKQILILYNNNNIIWENLVEIKSWTTMTCEIGGRIIRMKIFYLGEIKWKYWITLYFTKCVY